MKLIYQLKYYVQIVLVASVSLATTDTIKPYGFVLPTWSYATAATESFSQPNASAYTAAGNPAIAVSAESGRSTFQVAQSRLGVTANPAADVLGRLEVDFIDFSKSSPTTAALPRLRRATIEYQPCSAWLFKFGQDWDLISPLAPHSYNFVGHYFQQGDIGFMRLQLQSIYQSPNFEYGFALGLPGSNNAASENTLELGVLPTLAFRGAYRPEKESQYGFSVLLASLRNRVNDSDRFFAGAATLFAQKHFAGKTEIHSEAYLGENTFNLGLLGLGFRNTNSSTFVREAGAYLTVKTPLTDAISVFGGAGGSWVLNPEEVLSSYSGTALTGTGPGIEGNWTARVGVEKHFNEKFLVFLETAGLFTRHHLQTVDLAKYDPNRKAFIAQLGGMLSF